uniref:alpha-tectorin-like isoform X2 n=1 Tax=Scatophagus argus TaxID=75038 RepID=UPI001ED80348|nr:alpha-tectorin-like isoform X2 [Scatophagus argus]XP_046237392.1 alpha-tectorin-like isoform X2 [Scatophagus argus]
MSNQLTQSVLMSRVCPSGAQQTVTGSGEVDISTYPITFYGVTYTRLYVNFMADKFTVCFTGFYDPQVKQDCIVLPPPSKSSAEVSSYGPSDRLNNYHRRMVPTIKNNHQGQTEFHNFKDSYAMLILVNFGTQATLYYYESGTPNPFVITTLVNGETFDTFNVKGSSSSLEDAFDISGCRQSGVVYRAGEAVSIDPETCSYCDETVAIQTAACGPLERCQQNGMCALVTVCTVTGPTVIDVHEQLNSVQDRCTYTLMTDSSVPDLHIMANFREHRRKDVSFVDSVTLLKGQTQIDLKQGGRALVNTTTLTLSSSAQTVEGVELSKDQTTVTAKVTASSFTISVFFDDHTAHITFTGSDEQIASLQGLCANSSSLSEVKLPEFSTNGCDVEHNDTVDSTIDCEDMTERCGLLNETIFSSCHSHTDPTPYITACADTLCSYPDVDGLYCQFMEAYARACSLRSNDTLDWRTEIGCSSPQVFCQDRICSDHEFCAQTVSGEPACFCRAIFASPYRSTDSYGDPTVCDHNSASATLVGCLLEEKGFDYTALHLNDETCRGEMDELTHMVTFSFDSSNTCGAVVTTNNSQLIYKNTIVVQNSSSVITRNDQVYIDFSCIYTQPDIKTMSFRIRDSSVVQHITSGSWNYNLTMKAYTNAGLTQAVVSGTEVRLNQKIWVELDTEGLEGSFVSVVMDSCWATDQESPSASPRYDLIIDGCANPADQTVEVEGSGMGTSTSFSFHMFQFTGSSGEVYLHCQVHLCAHDEETCTPVCNAHDRRRRSARLEYADEASAFITMAWIH